MAEQLPPAFIEAQPASGGQSKIVITLTLGPDFEQQCREAALWFLSLPDRARALFPGYPEGPEYGYPDRPIAPWETQ
jgi:hypothetical protein